MASFGYSGKIADILIRKGVLKPEALEEAKAEAAAGNVGLEKYLVDKLLVPRPEMTLALAEYLNMPPITLIRFTPDSQILEMIPREVLTRHLAIPIARTAKTLTVALGDPFDIIALDELRTFTGMEITPLVANEKEIEEALARLFVEASEGLDMEHLLKDTDGDVEVGREETDEPSLDEMLESAEGAPVIRMVNMILLEAIRKRASDIHLEPMEKRLRLRYRVDGNLIESPSPPKNLQPAIISRIKIMSNLDIAERRVPQDGRFRIRAIGKEIDIRVSCLPTVHGEKIVMRTLDKSALFANLGALGLEEHAFKALSYAISQPHGIILVTGPTGSGKTTTLYSCLQELNKPDVNIVTCEDPVEYQVEGINQVAINADVGMSFASALRSILRQDPDVVLVGEIRDRETADIAVRAALTGHLVLSTLHTNDAAGAVARLTDSGVERFLVASSLVLAQAQRLYRKLCPFCKKETKVPDGLLETNNIAEGFFDAGPIYAPVGCPKCNNTGFKGRGAIMEVLPVDEEIRAAILKGCTPNEIRSLAMKRGMLSLKMTGLQRVRDGITSIEAALEVTGGE